MGFLFGQIKKKYYGNYVNNLKEGFGIFYWNDGYRYEGFWKGGKQDGYGFIRGSNGDKYGYWNDGKLKEKINDDKTILFINNSLDESKKKKEYNNFILNISKYEKQIVDGSSSQGTNFNSKNKDKEKNIQNYE